MTTAARLILVVVCIAGGLVALGMTVRGMADRFIKRLGDELERVS